MISRILISLALVATLLNMGCATRRPNDTTHVRFESPMQARPTLESNLRTLRSVSTQLDEIRKDFFDFHRRGSWRKRGYFTAEENDRIEDLFFHFTTGHTALWDLVNYYEGTDVHFSDDETGIKAHVLVLYAEFLLAYHSSFLVAEFSDDPVAISKLNEAFYRSGIPRGGYNRLHQEITAKGEEKTLTAAWVLYSEDLSAPESGLSKLAATDPAYKDLIGQMPSLHKGAQIQIHQVLKTGTLSGLENDFSHTEADQLAHGAAREFGDARYAARALLFKDVSRLKSPTAHKIKFSEQQKQQVYHLLQPGDIILTYTAGYMSDVFIPGAFKHGITYVGSPAQRKNAGLNVKSLSDGASHEKTGFAAHFSRESLPGGLKADMIEAVAEGVIFNNLSYIMDTHVNRMLVLRPRLNDEEKTEFLAGVFTWLGDPYDFRFDFADASRQVCTEVIYRALDGKGGITFTLTKRAGHETLSADDIVRYHIASESRLFELVLFAEENQDAQHHEAVILEGSEGERRIKALMANIKH